MSDGPRTDNQRVLPRHYVDELVAVARAGGLDAVGVCRAAPFAEARDALEARKASGYDAGMQFTYRNPARSTDPSMTVRDARSLIVGALFYRHHAPPQPATADGPSMRVAAFAWRGYYDMIRAAFAPVVDRLRHDGHRAIVAADENCLVDRAAAVRAGLGWYGKNANVLLPGAGSWFLFGSVITDALLVADDPAPVADGCGGCRRCIDNCPTAAIVAPGVVDARRCLAWHVQAPGVFPREYRIALADRVYGCDDCQEVCPPNRRADLTATAADAQSVAHALALDVLSASDDDLAARFDSWYIHDRDVDTLRRNALIVLGNALAGDPGQRTPRAREALRRYLTHRRPLLRAHAAWAAERGGCHDLLALVRDDTDPLVHAELPRAPSRDATREPGGAMTRHLLVTNDFPPKIGGIQSYLWELWRRLPVESFAVYCTPHRGAAEFDRAQPFRVIRSPEPVLLPYPWLAKRVDELADEFGASLVMLDPALPLGAIGPRLRHPYGVVLHGAEVTVPARLPALRPLLGHVLRGARIVVAAGSYPADEATRAAGAPLPVVVVPPGVDVDRFRPLTPGEIDRARLELGLPAGRPLVLAVSRLVPRKGFDTMLRAASRARASVPDLVVAIAGAGRDRGRLERLAAELDVPAVFLGRVPDSALPSLYGCADVFAMLCRVRWGGLEQEGFGIVFVEAAAAGVAQVAGASGGAAEAVEAGVTGFVIDPPTDVQQVSSALVELLRDATLRDRMGAAARARAVREFRYDVLTERLSTALDAVL